MVLYMYRKFRDCRFYNLESSVIIQICHQGQP